MFDRTDEESVFLSFVKEEFVNGRGTKLRSELADKDKVLKYIEKFDITWPNRIFEIKDIESIKEASLPSKFVLKYAHGWSSRGVMLLEKIDGSEKYLELLSQRMLSIQDIIDRQVKVASSFNRENLWIVEEKVSSLIPGKKIPFDYKFYCFQGKVGLVVQIDRNTNPPKVCLFNGDFFPLRHKKDYILRSKNAQMGIHLIPYRAEEMLFWAKKLSMETDSPFVSVDLYDGGKGVCFGEFTFSPGGTFKRMWVFSEAYINKLDNMFVVAQKKIDDGVAKDIDSYNTVSLPLAVYGEYAAYHLNNGPRGSARMAEYFNDLATHQNGSDKQWYQHVSKAWNEIHSIAKNQQLNQLKDRERFCKSQNII